MTNQETLTKNMMELKSPLPSYIVPENISLILQEHAAEFLPKLAYECVKMYKQTVYLIHKEMRRPMYAINLESGSIKAVNESALAQEERFQNFFAAWMDNTDALLIHELRKFRARFTDFEY